VSLKCLLQTHQSFHGIIFGDSRPALNVADICWYNSDCLSQVTIACKRVQALQGQRLTQGSEVNRTPFLSLNRRTTPDVDYSALDHQILRLCGMIVGWETCTCILLSIQWQEKVCEAFGITGISA
jgi:hypothetical protein